MNLKYKEVREPRREAPRRNIIESKHTEAAPPSGRRTAGMNVQGCHNILAICSHIEFEKMTASGPVHHPLKTYTIFSSHHHSELYYN